ncbi:ATP-binding cassette domain-containing protein [Weissella coleopterorum]|uniref:ATP-binding cassette domain-containing protein n=1 Tax=Weissella coleopterorum TaxID=2714949 RepID=A0A6G8AZ94_9LACO|nr:ATP-binding cassette domain-containing protein [Weissella coleopterorum]QIL50384.1 ATP-binding cassette domain-containing protein [Weissella coleopterorum]
MTQIKDPILELIDATVVVNQGTLNEKIILDHVNFKMQAGDFVTVLGSNGAGKSTFLNVIAGSLPLTTGQILVNGQDVTKLNEIKRTHLIARVFQDPKMGTAPRMTVSENLLLAKRRGQRHRLTSRKLTSQVQNQFKTLLDQMGNGLGQRLNVATGDLSGGQRQALSFVMATITKPAVLLLDEHTAALDPKTSAQLLKVTDERIKADKLTALMITHNLEDALSYGNRLIIINAGQIEFEAKDQSKNKLTLNDLLEHFKRY